MADLASLRRPVPGQTILFSGVAEDDTSSLAQKIARDQPSAPWGPIPTNPSQGERDRSIGWDQKNYGWKPRPLGLAPIWRWPAPYRMGDPNKT